MTGAYRIAQVMLRRRAELGLTPSGDPREPEHIAAIQRQWWLRRDRAKDGSPMASRSLQTIDELRTLLLRDPARSAGIRPSEIELERMGLTADWCRPTPSTTLEHFVAKCSRHSELAVELLLACLRVLLNAFDEEGES